ncbi:tryptophan 2,3-dioxygenase [Actinokineospora baliensis]|nr:tryptophan 2,3-dioxygenase [Actinokineospora baliensis]
MGACFSRNAVLPRFRPSAARLAFAGVARYRHHPEGIAVTVDYTTVLTYSSYLALDDILAAQRPTTDEHDELLFIIVHQVHELWFKELLHEFTRLQRELAAGQTTHALHALHRSHAIVRAVVAQIDVIETMTPRQFLSFRAGLRSGSGFQSAQFREVEAALGGRDARVLERYPADGAEHGRLLAAMNRPCIYDSFLHYLSARGYDIPQEGLDRDVTQPLEPSPEIQKVLALVYADDGGAAQVCERLVDLDHGIQEWRYRHVKMVERMIGDKPGTGGSTGVAYLRATLFKPLFPDLAAVRSTM